MLLGEMLQNIRRAGPTIHCITNRVTVNDCANILLACGAAPIMADDIGEVEEITALSDGLTINIGTLDQRMVPAMIAAGRQANRLGHPVVLDPVGAGASSLRTETAFRLLQEIRFTAIRGNISEIKVLFSGSGATHGVEANAEDHITAETMDAYLALARGLAERTGAVVAMTGQTDIVSDGRQTACIRNGHPMMGKITGSGCQLSVLTAAFLAANPGCPMEAVTAAVGTMGLCGEIAYGRLTPQDGNATYRNYLIDAVYQVTPEELEAGIHLEMR